MSEETPRRLTRRQLLAAGAGAAALAGAGGAAWALLSRDQSIEGEREGVTLTRSEGELRFATSDAVAVVRTDAFQLALETADGRPLARQTPGALGWRTGAGQSSVGAVRGVRREDRSLFLTVDAGQTSAAVTLAWRTDRTLDVVVRPDASEEVTEYTDAYALGLSEVVYGLSERVGVRGEEAPDGVPPRSEYDPQEVGSLNRRSEVVEMLVQPTIALYSPFYQTSAGYGLYVAGTTPGAFDVGAADPGVLRFRFETGTTPESRELRYHLFAGPSHAAILDEYTALTGRPFLPPEWAFKHWRWRDELPRDERASLDGVEVNAEVAEDVLKYEELGIPAGVYLIDRPWSDGEFGFSNFNWDEQRLPNAEAMLASLEGRGYRIGVFTTCWALGRRPGDNGAEASERGYLAPNSDRTIDLTNPDARRWWKEKHVAFTRRWNVSAWKLDRGEERIPSERTDVWADGRTGREVRNAYPLLQAQLLHEALQEARSDDFAIIARAGYAGAQRYAASWGGDITGSKFFGEGSGTDLGLRSAIIGLQRAGFIGFPFWGSDTGGYYQFMDREVFARWLEFSCFCPIMEIGGTWSHAPWDMPLEPVFDLEMAGIYLKYVRLHHDLIPYTVRHAQIAAETGLPVARALVFDFPDDEAVIDRWDEYMYGSDILVAPVWRTRQRSRQVYLPAGMWESFWDREAAFQGPATVTVDAPLNVIPVFVRAVADIPGRP